MPGERRVRELLRAGAVGIVGALPPLLAALSIAAGVSRAEAPRVEAAEASLPIPSNPAESAVRPLLQRGHTVNLTES